MDAGLIRKPVPQNGYAIRAIREREGLSITELAVVVNVSDPHLRNIELEHKAARPETIALIARTLRCPIAAIVRGETQRVPESEAA